MAGKTFRALRFRQRLLGRGEEARRARRNGGHALRPGRGTSTIPRASQAKKVDYLVEMRNSGRDKVKDYADRYGCAFYPGEKPWGVKADVYMPCATQNDVNINSAKKIVASGSKYYIEVANMPTTNDALAFLMEQKHMIVAPSKAVNAGGVATSALEMSQNSMRPELERGRGRCKAAHDHEEHPRQLRQGRRGERAGLQSRRRREHRGLCEGCRRHAGAGDILNKQNGRLGCPENGQPKFL